MEVNLITTCKNNRTCIHKITHNDSYALKTSNLDSKMQYTEKDLCSHMGTDFKDGVGAPAATNIRFVTLRATILYSYGVWMFSTIEYKTHMSVILQAAKNFNKTTNPEKV